MQYMLSIIADETKPMPPTPALMKLMQGYKDFTDGLVQSGQLRGAVRLHPSAMATTVRETNGKRAITDGPAASGTEHLAGYFLVECAHLDEALAIAGRIPGVQLGEAIEIRPVVPNPGG